MAKGMESAGSRQAYLVTVLPVIPPDLHNGGVDGRFATSDLNDLYRAELSTEIA